MHSLTRVRGGRRREQGNGKKKRLGEYAHLAGLRGEKGSPAVMDQKAWGGSSTSRLLTEACMN